MVNRSKQAISVTDNLPSENQRSKFAEILGKNLSLLKKGGSMKNKKDQEINYTLNLTKSQIAIIKAGLQYYWLADDYGYALWGTMPGACFGTSDIHYRHKVGEIYEVLKKLTKVKPDYGWWGDIKRIGKLCEEHYKIAKKEGKEAERRMYEDVLLHETISEHFKKHGLNGEEIAGEVLKEFNKKVSEIKPSLTAKGGE